MDYDLRKPTDLFCNASVMVMFARAASSRSLSSLPDGTTDAREPCSSAATSSSSGVRGYNQ